MCEVKTRDHLTAVKIQAAVLSETLVHFYQSKRHCRTGEADEGKIE
jgi:hypothetical protein